MLPKFKYFYRPVLETIANNQPCTKVSIIPKVCSKLKLSEEDVNKTTASGRNVIYSRITWTLTYLKKAGMINKDGNRPAHYSITKQGKMLLDRNYEVIDNWILGQLSENFAKYQYIPKCVKCAKRTL